MGLLSPTTWLVWGWPQVSASGSQRAREWPAKCPRVVRQGVTWPVWWEGGGGRKRDFFKYSSINGYFKKPILQERGANICPYLTSMSKSAYLLSMSCEKRISCLYSVHAYISEPERLFFLSQRHYILQATSLQKTVNLKNKAGQNSTCGTVSSLFFSHWKVLLHSLHIQHLLCGFRLKIQDLIAKEAFH